MVKPRTPARSVACRIWSSSGFWVNATRTCVPPLKSTPSGIWCQNKMLRKPAIEKISENPRKYHFFPSQSIFVVRNSSKLTPKPSAATVRPRNLSKNLNRQCCAALFLLQNRFKNHARYQHRGKQVGKQSDRQRHRKSPHRTRAKQEQNHRRNNRRHVSVDDRRQRMLEPLVHRCRSSLSGPQLFADALK